MKKLKPCKCGSTNRAVLGESVFLKDGYYVSCGHCGARTELFDTKQGAIDAWNKRS